MSFCKSTNQLKINRYLGLHLQSNTSAINNTWYKKFMHGHVPVVWHESRLDVDSCSNAEIK